MQLFTTEQIKIIIDALRGDIGHRRLEDPTRDRLVELIAEFMSELEVRNGK